MRTFIGLRCITKGVCTITLALGLVSAQTTAQQSAIISGVVYDQATKLGLEGADVRIVGTRFRAVTGRHGEYQFRGIEAGVYEIEARRVGYLPDRDDSVAVEAGSVTKAYLVLRPHATILENVVTAANGLTSENLVVPARDAAQSLQGKVAGVTVMSSGRPGSEVMIQLRAATSIRGNRPLIIVDGVILATSQASTLDLSTLDIRSIEVLKGASASAMYGARGAAGVIIIRTDRGRE